MGNTTHFYGSVGAGAVLANTVYGKAGGTTSPAKGVYVQNAGVAKLVYSTPTVSVSNTGAASGSGGSSSGTVSASVTATPGGYGSGNYSYSYSGGGGYSITSGVGTANPTFSATPTGAPASGLSTIPAATWTCTLTDNVTGATYSNNFTVGPFTWNNTTAAYGPFTASGGGYSGSGSSPTGTARTVSEPWSGQSSPLTVPASGGPTSGNFSYNWSITSGGHSPSFNDHTLAQPTISDTFSIPAQATLTDTITAQCVITDNVSGYSYTLTGVTFSFTYTNNYG